MMNKISSALLLSFTVMLAFTGCHGKGGGTETTAPPTTTTTPDTSTNPTTTTTGTPGPPVQVLSGIFVDSPVEGLTYLSGGQTGTTDAAGGFKYEADGNVQFSVGKIVLGQAQGKTLITPVDLVKALDPSAATTDSRVLQIVEFLMGVNANPPTALTMSVPASVQDDAKKVIAADLSRDTVDVAGLLTLLVPAVIPPTAAEAAAHIQSTLAGLAAPKAGIYAAVDSAANPTLGVMVSATPNAAGDTFSVSGKAVSSQGAAWNIAGTMANDGSLLATGTGIGSAPPANMTITGSMTTATQLTAVATATLNNVAKQVSLTFEKAVAPVAAGKFALSADPGVTNAGQVEHMAAVLNVNADGSVVAHLAHGMVSGIPAAPKLRGRWVGLSGVQTASGNIIAIGGILNDPDSSVTASTTVGIKTTDPQTITLLTGTVSGASITANMTAPNLSTGTIAATPLAFTETINANIGVYTGTNDNPVTRGLPGTWTFGVNADNTVHGFTLFLRNNSAVPPVALPTPYLIDGVIDVAGTLGLPTGVPLPFPGLNPGLVMTDDTGVTNITPGTFSGTIAAITGAAGGTWQSVTIAPPAAPATTTGSFKGSLLP